MHFWVCSTRGNFLGSFLEDHCVPSMENFNMVGSNWLILDSTRKPFQHFITFNFLVEQVLGLVDSRILSSLRTGGNET